MTVSVKLTWLNPSVAPVSQEVEVDLDGQGFVFAATVPVADPHEPRATPYEYTHLPGLAESTTVKYRIVTTGVTGAKVNGNEFSIEVPGENDIAAVNNLGGEVIVE